MKISLAIAPQDAQPSAFVVFRDRLQVAIPKAKALGYDGVELALARASDVVQSVVRDVLQDEGMRLAAVSSGRVFAEQKVWLTSPDEAIRQQAVDILRGLIDLAADLRAPRVNIGRVRGPVESHESRETAVARFVDAIRTCADYAAPAGINVVLEPVNRYEINFVNSVVPDGVEIVRRIGCRNVLLMPDVFHMNIEDASIADSLRIAGAMVGYVHLADSNRWAPGHGHTDFAAIFGALRDIGYDDDVTVEILPHPTADVAAGQAITYLRSLMSALDAEEMKGAGTNA